MSVPPALQTLRGMEPLVLNTPSPHRPELTEQFHQILHRQLLTTQTEPSPSPQTLATPLLLQVLVEVLLLEPHIPLMPSQPTVLLWRVSRLILTRLLLQLEPTEQFLQIRCRR